MILRFENKPLVCLQGYGADVNNMNSILPSGNALTTSLDGMDSALQNYAALFVNGGVTAITIDDITRFSCFLL